MARLSSLFRVPVDNVELVRAQFQAFAKQIPLMYFILATNTMAVVFTYARFGHPWLSVYLPTGLCLVCVLRGVWWWRLRRAEVSDAQAIRHLQTTNKMAIIMVLGFTGWGFMLFPFGDAYAQGQIVFFMALTQISCIFCLMHLRPSALLVTLLGVGPFSLFFCFAGMGHFRAEAINLALVAVGMIAILTIYYRDFANLVDSRRSLIEKQAETQRLSDENLQLANIDSLSGLPNRRALMAALEMRQASRRQFEAQIIANVTAIVFVDLDGFKDVNDTYGHETGDTLIRIVSAAFARLLPPGAMLARLGGDEFAALMSGEVPEEHADRFAADVLDRLTSPVRIGERTIAIGASLGIAADRADRCDAQELFRRADVAMYHVKAHGKGGVMVYSHDLDAERQRQQDIEDDMRRGLAAGEFDVFYQPIVDASTHAVVSVEALVRWPGQTGSTVAGGIMGPDAFIPIAESSGLIHALGLFVLRRACADMAALPGIKLSVNISPAQFRDPGFEARVMEVLAETGFPADRLELELTEGYLIDHPRRAAAAITAFKDMGVSVALDDFGTGYTSIAYLQEYGFNRIKIDKSLASRIATDKKVGVLIAGAVYMANGLDMAVTAEGVETEEQAVMLRLAGCQCLQGFKYSRPKPLPDLLAAGLAQGLRLGQAA